MADITLNTTNGLTIARELLIAYLNTGTAASMSIYLVLMIIPIAILFLWLSRNRED